MMYIVRPRMLLVAMACTAAVSCGGGSDTIAPPAPDAAVGVYTLTTINGQALPVVIEQAGNDKAEITAGVVTLKADKTFTDITQVRVTVSGNVSSQTENAAGTWTRQVNTVQFTPAGFTAYSMTWDGGNRLTQVIDAFTLIYIK